MVCLQLRCCSLLHLHSGKTKILRSLYKTYQNMKRKPIWQDLNPKAVTNDELFGYINPATREWKDGKFITSSVSLNIEQFEFYYSQVYFPM